MKLKNKIIALVAGLTLAFTGTMGSYSYFKANAEEKNNTITTGTFPKARVRIYASVGPLYTNAVTAGQNYATDNYRKWLDNACKYIVNDMEDKKPLKTIDYGQVSEFNNIPNNNDAISIKNDVGTYNTYSWKGQLYNNIGQYEQGTMIHYIVAISNGAPYGGERRKLDYAKESINVQQYDIYKGNNGKEYKVNQTKKSNSSSIPLIYKEERVRTYSWEDSKYISKEEHTYPSRDADLIVFDVGSKGYYVSGTYQSGMDGLIMQMSGYLPMWQENGNSFNTNWIMDSPMYDTIRQMHKENAQYASLIRTECNIKFRYSEDDKDSPSDSYKVNIVGENPYAYRMNPNFIAIQNNNDENKKNTNKVKRNSELNNKKNQFIFKYKLY